MLPRRVRHQFDAASKLVKHVFTFAVEDREKIEAWEESSIKFGARKLIHDGAWQLETGPIVQVNEVGGTFSVQPSDGAR